MQPPVGKMPADKPMTQEEVSAIGKAMKRKKFRGLMQEYVDEVTDPANRDEYDAYLSELEAKREMPKGMELLRPEPGMCVVTSLRFPSGQKQKLFLNLCHSPHLAEIGVKPDEADRSNVELPFTMGPPRPDKDEAGDTALTCDFCVHTMTLARCVDQLQILKVMVDIASENLTKNFLKGHEEVMKDFTVLEIKCKGGRPYPMSVKEGTVKKDPTKKNLAAEPEAKGGIVTPSELRQMKKDARKRMGKSEEPVQALVDVGDDDDEEKEEEITRIRVPKHKLLHVGLVDMAQFMGEANGRQQHIYREIPKELKLVVELPTVKSVADCDLDVAADNVVLEVADKFYLDLPLPYEIDAAKAKAKFDKNRKPAELQVVMPVVPKKVPLEEPQFAWVEAVDEPDRLDNLGEEEPLPDLMDEPEPAEPAEPEAPDEPEAPSSPPRAEPAKPVRRERLDAPEDCEAPAAPAVVEVDASTAPDFTPAEAWQGPRPGCVFKTGDRGLGYYRDVPFQPPPRPAPPPPKKEELLVPREAKVVRTFEAKPKKEAGDAVDMGEPAVVAEGENAARLWAAFRPEGTVRDVHIALRPNQVRVSWVAAVDEERHAYQWRRMIKHDIDTRQVHWEWTGRDQKEILVLLRKDGIGVWGEGLFTPIAAGAAADEEWPEEPDAPEEEVAIVAADPAEQDVPAPAQEPEVPEALAGDALLGQAIPLETRLFIEIF